MTATQYSMLMAVIFGIIAIVQVFRGVTGVPTIVIGGTAVPTWVNWVAFVVAAIIAWLGYSASHT